MTKLFEWVYPQKTKWNIFCNGKNISSLKTKRDAISKGRDFAKSVARDMDCLVELIVQDDEGGVEVREVFGKKYEVKLGA